MDEINSINSMLIECVRAIGSAEKKVGSIVVGNKLWPEKEIISAQKLLLACLNEDRPEKLTPDQAFLIESWAKSIGCHVAIEYRCKTMSYSIPTPIEPEDEKAVLMREFILAQRAMTQLAEKINGIKL